MREALKFLTLSGLLEAKRGQGTYICEQFTDSLAGQMEWSLFLSAGQVEQLLEVRKVLEALAARLAADRATPDEKEAITVYRELLEMEERDLAGSRDRPGLP